MATVSTQPRLQQTEETTNWLWTAWSSVEQIGTADVPAWGSPQRAVKLREVAQSEPILSGALSSMVSKVVSFNWQLTGPPDKLLEYHELLADAEDGAGWSYLVDRWVQDYLNTDMGGILELGRDGEDGPVSGLYGVDSARVRLTGSVRYPLRYYPTRPKGDKQESIPWRPGDFVRIVDMPSPDERYHGLGHCAVTRAIKAAKVLFALYRYESEKLADLPLPGIVAITGMTQKEVMSAFQLYEQMRESKQQVTFRGLLWLASQVSPLNRIETQFTSFASLPENFNREEVITHYVYTLALDFGVDVREFWPASQTGATKAEAKIQAEKAKGKGIGRLVASIERAINWEILPPDVGFAFVQEDSEADRLRHEATQMAIQNVRRLWEPAPVYGEGIITTEEARRWLVQEGVIPSWLSDTDQNILDSMPLQNMIGPVNTETPLVQKAIAQGRMTNQPIMVIDRHGNTRQVWSPNHWYAAPDWPIQAPAPALAGVSAKAAVEVPPTSSPFGPQITE